MMSEAEVRDASLASLAVLKQLGPEILWMHSFVTDDKIYCIFWAPHEELIREHGKRAGFPVDRVAAVRRILVEDKGHDKHAIRAAAYWKQGAAAHHENLESEA